MNIESLIQDNVIKIIKEGGYNCVEKLCEDENLTKKLLAMTSDFDTHLSILLRHYESHCVVSAYPWFENDIHFLGRGEELGHKECLSRLDHKMIFNVVADFDIIDHFRSRDDYSIVYRDAVNVPTAFFKITYNEGETYRACFNNLRNAIVGRLLAKTA